MIDTNGAGDVFHGAYICSYLRQPEQAAGMSTSSSRARRRPSRSRKLGNEAGLPTLADIAAVKQEFRADA